MTAAGMGGFRPHANLSLKLISLGLALGLWSVVPDSSVPHLVRGVRVQLLNIPSELALSEPFDAEIEVWVHGSASRAGSLLPGELSPRIDLFGAFVGENVISLTPSDIPTPLGVSVDSIQPSQVRVLLEDKVRVELPVNAVVEGRPAPGFEIYETTVTPATVFVAGPQSRVEQLADVSTEAVNVSGRRVPVARNVTIVSDDPLVTIENTGARLTIAIEETPAVFEIDDVAVTVVNDDFRVVVNPSVIGVVLSGPPSLVEGLSADNIIAEIDAAGLSPRLQDYRIEPRIRFRPAELAARITVLAKTPQRRLDVHVFETPSAGSGR